MNKEHSCKEILTQYEIDNVLTCYLDYSVRTTELVQYFLCSGKTFLKLENSVLDRNRLRTEGSLILCSAFPHIYPKCGYTISDLYISTLKKYLPIKIDMKYNSIPKPIIDILKESKKIFSNACNPDDRITIYPFESAIPVICKSSEITKLGNFEAIGDAILYIVGIEILSGQLIFNSDEKLKKYPIYMKI